MPQATNDAIAFVDKVSIGLTIGKHTDQIADDAGTQYKSLTRRLDRLQEFDLLKRITDRREVEYADHRGCAPRMSMNTWMRRAS